jgi:hypothetical protein
MLRLGTLTGSYGRDYRNKKDLLNDWNSDKDFRDSWSGQHTNRADLNAMGTTTAKVRYNRLQSVTVLTRVKGHAHWKAS